MKKYFLFVLLVALTVNIVNAQVQSIAVQKDGNVSFYTNFNDAVTNAPAGADIIVPGGTWTNQPVYGVIGTVISKELHLYGAGYYEPATGATAVTRISPSQIQFTTGSDNSTITGIEFSQLYIDGTVNNLDVHRCKGGIMLMSGYITNFKCSESMINFIYGGDVHGVIFEKNIITNIMGIGLCTTHPDYYWNAPTPGSRFIDYAVFNHNVIICASNDDMIRDVKNSLYSNNIIVHDKTDPYTGYNNTFQNNIFTGTFTLPDANGNKGMNNISNITVTDIFVNWVAPNPGWWWEGRDLSYDLDLHLKSTCQGKNYATDGTDLGIYGTSAPYKEGAVPILPHYLECNIPGQLDAQGKLNISVTVEAQTK